MTDYVFTDRDFKPEETSLESALGVYFAFYNELMELAHTFKKEWHYYKTGGWVQKVFSSKKALYHFIPLHNACKVHLTIRENERERLLADAELCFIHKDLQEAKKYPEGYAIYLEINTFEATANCLCFVDRLIKIRLN